MTDYKFRIYLNDLQKQNKIKALNKIYTKTTRITPYELKGLNTISNFNPVNKKINHNGKVKYKINDMNTFSIINDVKDANRERVFSIIKEDFLDFNHQEDFSFQCSLRLLGYHKNNQTDYQKRLKRCNNNKNDDEYENNFDENVDIIKENDNHNDIVNDLLNEEEKLVTPSNINENHSKQRKFFEDSTDKLIFDELERKVFKNEKILERKEDNNNYTSLLQKMENKAITIQKCYRKFKLVKLLSVYKDKIYTGWDEEKENLILFFKGNCTEDGKLLSVFVKIYSMTKMLFFYESFTISELYNKNQAEVELNNFLTSIKMVKDKVVNILYQKLSKNKKEDIPNLEEEGYNFDENIPDEEEKYSIHEENIKNVESISSIKEVDYSNI